ncbi:MAG: hemolysin family protein [Planctomycetota bacterium]
MALTLTLVALLLLLNALCVAAEYSVVSARKSRVRAEAERGGRLAKGLLPVLEQPVEKDRYISGCQLGITVTSLALGAIAEGELADTLIAGIDRAGLLVGVAAHSLAVAIVLVVLTFVQVAFAEVLPKALALQFPTPVVLGTSPIVRVWLFVLAIPIRVFTASSNFLLRLFRLPQPGHAQGYTPNEIQLLVDESRRGGVLAARTSHRLQHALEMQERPVRRLMVPRKNVFAVDLDQPVDAVVAAVMGSDYTRIPVFRGTIDEIVGAIHTKDLALRHVEQGGVGDLDGLVRPVLYVPETTSADRVLADMRSKGVAQAIVVDEFGGMVGLATLEDLLTDVVGSVRRRTDSTMGVERLPDGRLRLPGNMRIDQAAQVLGVSWKGYANTVGGFVIERLGRVPARGESFELDGLKFEVEGVQRNLITALQVRMLPPREVRDG